MPHPRDEEIQNAFNRALSEYATAHPEVVRTVEDALDEVMDTAALEAEQATLVMRIEGLGVMLDNEVQANTRTTQDQQAYWRRFVKVVADFTAATTCYDELTEQITEKQRRGDHA